MEFGPIGQIGGGVTSSGTFTVPNTGGWAAPYTGITVPVTLAAGSQWMRVVMDTNGSSGWVGNVDDYTFAPASGNGTVLLSRSGWIASASVSGSNQPPSASLDNNTSTQWQTGTVQANGQWFEMDMGASQSFDKIVLDQTNVNGDYPRGYQVFVSSDSVNWGSAIATGAGTNGANTTITFPVQTKRYIKIVQTGTTTYNWWSIAEFYVYY